ncbi:MAG: flagellar FlbD family protein [Planctomycetota bacterium]
MITLTKLNGKAFVLNCELIRTIEESPDTVITLTTGDHMLVKEPMREIVGLSIEYGRLMRQGLGAGRFSDRVVLGRARGGEGGAPGAHAPEMTSAGRSAQTGA